jgi:hypothetical protein
MRNDRVGRVLSVPYRTVTAAAVSLPERPGAGRGYSAGTPNPDEAVLGRSTN